jgi:4-amino-4-deoxy-L-arabinose transferase-like glycosyltransferase
LSFTLSRAASPRASSTTTVRWLEAPIVLTFAVLAYMALAVGYVEKTPIWQNPDEPAHFNYIEQVADTASLPTLQPGDWDTQLLERLKNGRLEPSDSIASIRYEGWQPPFYYIVAAPLFRLTEAEPILQQVDTLRLFDAALGALTLIVAYVAAREVLRPSLSVTVPVVMAGVPMFTAISASISADALANLLAAVLLLILLRTLRAPKLSTRHAAAVGALVAIGVLTKLALIIFLPLALAVVIYRSARPLRSGAALLIACALVGAPWLMHQVTSYGWTDPLATTRHALVTDQPRFPGLSPDYISSFLTISFHSFWAQFGWMAIVAPDRLYFIWGALCAVALIGLVIRGRKSVQPRRWNALWLLLLTTIVAAWLAYIGYNATFEQPQGRYLFTALTPLAICLVLGWAAWVPDRLRGAVSLALALALVVLNAYAQLRVLDPGFLGVISS